MKHIRVKHIVLAIMAITMVCLFRGCYNIFVNCEHEEYTSPQKTNTIIVQYDFMSRPTVYKKHWLWDNELWSYPGSGFMETVHFGVEWLSEESFRIFYEDVRDDKYNEDFTITIP